MEINKNDIKEYNTHWCFCSDDIEDRNIFKFGESNICLINRGKEYKSFAIKSEKQFIYELVINAISEKIAFEIAKIIKCSLIIINPEQKLSAESIYSDFEDTSSFLWDKCIFFACEMAAKAYGEKNKEYAILKYDKAMEITPICINCLERGYYEFEDEYAQEINFSLSIILCYSILEELGLEIKASNEKPSTNETEWNKEIFDEFTKRLRKNGINPKEKIAWLKRSTDDRPYKSNIISTTELCDWSNNDNIKDFEIMIYNAILELSYMRSKVASHRMDKKISKLKVYDIQNAYLLCRKILMRYFDIAKEYTKFFNDFMKSNEKIEIIIQKKNK